MNMSILLFSIVFLADMFSGTWSMNPAKSVDSGIRTNVSQYTVTGNGIKLVGDSVNATGIKSHLEFTAQFDGKDYPMVQTVDGKAVTDVKDRVVLRKVDDYTVELTRKREGKVVLVIQMVVSPDGKMLTSSVRGSDQGQPFEATTVFDKQ
jgi:hypothetical protein